MRMPTLMAPRQGGVLGWDAIERGWLVQKTGPNVYAWHGEQTLSSDEWRAQLTRLSVVSTQHDGVLSSLVQIKCPRGRNNEARGRRSGRRDRVTDFATNLPRCTCTS